MARLQVLPPTASAGQSGGHCYQQFDLALLNGALGAEVTGVNLGQDRSTRVIEEIRHALNQHQVLVIRDQSLTSANLIDLGNQFGELHRNPFVKGLEGYPEIIEIKSEENHEKQFTGLWHSDISWAQKPSMGSLLYAIELPPFGGDTLFANMAQAFAALSPGMQTLLTGLRAEHRVDRYHSSKSEFAELPDATVYHPVVTTHPETGEPVLFVNEYFTSRFENMSEQESAPLLHYLFTHSTRPDFTCRVQWQPGTLVFWDNRSTMHYATNDYPGHNRLMHRVTIAGVAPV